MQENMFYMNLFEQTHSQLCYGSTSTKIQKNAQEVPGTWPGGVNEIGHYTL